MGIFGSKNFDEHLNQDIDSNNNELNIEECKEEKQSQELKTEKPKEKPKEKIDNNLLDFSGNQHYKITYKDFQEYFEKLHGRKMDRNDLWEYLANESSKDSFIDLDKCNIDKYNIDKYQNSSSWN